MVPSKNTSLGQASSYGFLALVVFLTFGARFVLAGWNSYWLDELYSVEVYALHHETVLDAVRHLAQTSIHPPLYQAVLYYWVDIFGDTEIATRTLSNVSMTLAVIFTHRYADRIFGRFVANTSALALSLTYLVMFYGLETRSYGMSLMWSTLSTMAILAYLGSRRMSEGIWSGARFWFWASILFGANLALMLTHYYNFFFWGAQALFAGVYVLWAGPVGSRLREFATLVSFYIVQFGVFFLVWGRVTLQTYADSAGRFQTDSVTFTPLRILDSVTVRSLNFGPLNLWSLALVASVLAVIVVRSWPNRKSELTGQQLMGILYLATMTVAAPTLAYLTFQVAQAERLVARYVLYLLPGIVILITLAITKSVRGLASWWTERSGLGFVRLGKFSVVYSIVIALVLVGPGAIRASRSVKDDWRGAARDMVAIVDSNPESDYIILEPAFRTTPVFDYYLARYSDDLRVTATIRRSEEARGNGYAFERLEDEIGQSDYMIVPFVHHRTSNFPVALELLKQKYEVEFWQIDDDSKGLVIFDVRSNS